MREVMRLTDPVPHPPAWALLPLRDCFDLARRQSVEALGIARTAGVPIPAPPKSCDGKR